jgi:hypothetical protein
MPRRVAAAGAALLILLTAVAAPGARAALPTQLSDAEFWRLVTTFSEPGGIFRSDNLVSNEDTYQTVLPELAAAVRPGGAYFGVGPDQNFTYIAALRPAVAFIVDLRRANLQLHLMYKALFELAPDRAAFVSRLFSRRLPAGVPTDERVDRLFGRLASAPPSRALYESTRAAVIDRLRRGHGFALSAADADGIAQLLETFFVAGPEISYSNTAAGWGQYPTFRDLQIAADARGVQRAYLATESNYRAVRSRHQRNAIVPLVGDFAGPTALAAAGAWVRGRGGVVTAFYASNVEQYLFEDGRWPRFAASVAALPVDDRSMFIRSCFNSHCATSGSSRSAVLIDPVAAMLRDLDAGLISSYADVLALRPPAR